MATSRNLQTHAFMEELCTSAGGYGRFFWTLVLHYYGWWVAVVVVPAVFLDHHRCEAKLPYSAWMLYASTLGAVVLMAVLLEFSVVQKLGLLQAGELISTLQTGRWKLPLLCTVLWKLDSYTDVVFIFVSRDCGSSLWWPSLATFVFGVLFGQLLFNTCFAFTDCDRELPKSFGFMLLDFQILNAAVREVLPFDPDESDLPVAGRPITLRNTSHLVRLEKVVGDIAQVSIQGVFLLNTQTPHNFVIFSMCVGLMHCGVCLALVMRECVQEEWSVQAQGLRQGTALLPPKVTGALNDEELDLQAQQQRTSSSNAWRTQPAGTGGRSSRDASLTSRAAAVLPAVVGAVSCRSPGVKPPRTLLDDSVPNPDAEELL